MSGGQISNNTAAYSGGGVDNYGTFIKTGGVVYGDDADQNLKNTVSSGFGSAVYQSTDKEAWRNVTAGLAMNPDSYGFWLNDGNIVTFPSGFSGIWVRSNYSDLTLTKNTIESFGSANLWVLQRVSGNTYTFKRADAASTMTLNIIYRGGSLVISGDSGSGQDNWNGTWNRSEL
jgi:hypothetical protein